LSVVKINPLFYTSPTLSHITSPTLSHITSSPFNTLLVPPYMILLVPPFYQYIPVLFNPTFNLTFFISIYPYCLIQLVIQLFISIYPYCFFQLLIQLFISIHVYPYCLIQLFISIYPYCLFPIFISIYPYCLFPTFHQYIPRIFLYWWNEIFFISNVFFSSCHLLFWQGEHKFEPPIFFTLQVTINWMA